MARFRYLGQQNTPGSGITWGPCTGVRMRGKDGKIHEIKPVPPKTKFEVGQDIGHDITEERCLRHFRADSRFEEIK